MTLTVTLNGNKSYLADSRAQKTADEFSIKYGLAGYQVVAIWEDSDQPLFHELDNAITRAAIEGLNNPADFDGYRLSAY
jgi:hypothetical protein